MGLFDGLIGDVVGGVLGMSGAQQQNSAAAASIKQQEDFQAQQSGTAHQREVADLRAAGLNPILSGMGGSGASSASGGSFMPTNTMAPLANSASNLGAREKMSAEQENTEADTDVKNSQQDSIDANTENTGQDTTNKKIQENVLGEQLKQEKLNSANAAKTASAIQAEAETRAKKAKMDNATMYYDKAIGYGKDAGEIIGGALLGKKLFWPGGVNPNNGMTPPGQNGAITPRDQQMYNNFRMNRKM